uniref:Uncharacterized protein At2g13580 n=1 Tax=Arabidopsis thaliana TaxID=3702 RepID=Q9SIT8_ARATH|nr:unknown protein [Arabidopsis thaliana]
MKDKSKIPSTGNIEILLYSGNIPTIRSSSALPSQPARQLTRLKHLVSRSVSSSSSDRPSQAARQLTHPKYLASRPVSTYKLARLKQLVSSPVRSISPAVNAVIDGDDIIYRDYVDISIAIYLRFLLLMLIFLIFPEESRPLCGEESFHRILNPSPPSGPARLRQI